jgi:lysophospholipase L1-like esterase
MITYVDVFSELIDDEGKLADEYSNDGIHLSDRGYQKILPTIFKAIINSLTSLL